MLLAEDIETFNIARAITAALREDDDIPPSSLAKEVISKQTSTTNFDRSHNPIFRDTAITYENFLSKVLTGALANNQRAIQIATFVREELFGKTHKKFRRTSSVKSHFNY